MRPGPGSCNPLESSFVFLFIVSAPSWLSDQLEGRVFRLAQTSCVFSSAIVNLGNPSPSLVGVATALDEVRVSGVEPVTGR